MQARRDSGDHPNVGLLMTPRNFQAPKGLPWAADNDAFGTFDATAYCSMLGKIAKHEGCLFVVAPDVVGDARATRQRFGQWRHVIAECGLPVAYVLQNGLEAVGVPWVQLDAVFVGGDTEFKFSEIVRRTLREAKERGKWTHVGRVNTRRRIEYLHSLGTVDSFDGSQFSRWSKTHMLWGARSTEYAQGGLL